MPQKAQETMTPEATMRAPAVRSMLTSMRATQANTGVRQARLKCRRSTMMNSTVRVGGGGGHMDVSAL